MNERPEITIVIPSRGRESPLREVLDGLARQDPPLSRAQLLVCLDANGTAPPALSGVFRLTVLHAERPGASAARNVGWRAAAAPLVLFLDDDVVPTARLVAEHLAWHRHHPQPEVGVLGAVAWSPKVRVTPFMRWLEHGVLFDYDSIEGTEAGWGRFYSANVSVKRALLELVGGFDEAEFPFLYEDLDLARRMYEHGFRLLYNPAAAGEHVKSETPESWRRRLSTIAGAERRFITRYPGERPYFHDRFRAAADSPPVAGAAAALVRLIPPSLPLLGRRVWSRYEALCWQRLAPEFLSAWERVP